MADDLRVGRVTVGLGRRQKRSNERWLGTGLQFRAVIVTVGEKTCLGAVPIGLRAVDGLWTSVRQCVYWPALEGSDLRIRGGVSASKEPKTRCRADPMRLKAFAVGYGISWPNFFTGLIQ